MGNIREVIDMTLIYINLGLEILAGNYHFVLSKLVPKDHEKRVKEHHFVGRWIDRLPLKCSFY